jgi:2-C-methyl-D-erythritol 4-phosphate cytidylyltransferase
MQQERMAALVVAAGKGLRMGTKESKQYLEIGGDTPVLAHTLLALERSPLIDYIVLVVGADDVDRCNVYRERFALSKLHAVVAGGTERQHSVRIGLGALPSDTEFVLIHDGVRPFLDHFMLTRIANALRDHGHDALVAAVPVKDTIKLADPTTQVISETLPRERLWAIQTPQAFRMSVIVAAHDKALADHFVGTDDAVLVERTGLPVHIVMGDYFNIKITTPDDLLLAEAIIQMQRGKES